MELGRSRIFSILLPTYDQTLFLRACVQEGESGRDAWRQLRELVPNLNVMLKKDTYGVKRIIPLLYDSLQRNESVVEKDLLTYLRAIYLREKLRSATYQRICRESLVALSDAKIPFVVLKGAALAEKIYGDWALRHCHDVDIWIRAKDLVNAVNVLRLEGFSLLADSCQNDQRYAILEHSSRLPIALHCDLIRFPYYFLPAEDLCSRAETQSIAGVPVKVLTPADMLLHICGHAAYSSSRDNLRWAIDAWYLIEQSTTLDWKLFIETTKASHLVLPMSVMLDYLAGELSAQIPHHVLDTLFAEVTRTPLLGIEAMFAGLRIGRRGSYRNLLKNADSMAARIVLLKWMLFPSANCLQLKYAVRSKWLLPFYYFYRPVKFIVHRILNIVPTNFA